MIRSLPIIVGLALAAPANPALGQNARAVPMARTRAATPAGPSTFVQQLFVVSNWHAELRVTC